MASRGRGKGSRGESHLKSSEASTFTTGQVLGTKGELKGRCDCAICVASLRLLLETSKSDSIVAFGDDSGDLRPGAKFRRSQ